MRHGITGGSAVLAALLCLNTFTLTASSTASPAEAVTETIQGEQLLIESTTTPELFSALAPGDIFEWDVSISTRDPAETIEAELFLEGNIPVEAAVLSCEESWSQPPNSGNHDDGCEDPAEIHQQALHEGSAPESFQVPQGHHLRLVLQAGSFDTDSSGEIYLRVIAEGEDLHVSPAPEDPSEGQSNDTVKEQHDTDTPSGDHSEDTAEAHNETLPTDMQESPPYDQEATDPPVDTPPTDASAPEGEQQDGLAATGTTIAAILAAALLLIGIGAYLRIRKTSASR